MYYTFKDWLYLVVRIVSRPVELLNPAAMDEDMKRLFQLPFISKVVADEVIFTYTRMNDKGRVKYCQPA